MRKRVYSTFLCAILLSFSLVLANPYATEAQTKPAPPIGFIYGGDMKPKIEGDKYYLYIYCNQFEGKTCTSPSAAMRIEIPPPNAFLRAFFN